MDAMMESMLKSMTREFFSTFIDSDHKQGKEVPKLIDHVLSLREKGFDYTVDDFPNYELWRKVEMIRFKDKQKISVDELKLAVDHWPRSETGLYNFIAKWMLCGDPGREATAKECHTLYCRQGLMSKLELTNMQSSWVDLPQSDEPWKHSTLRAVAYYELPFTQRVLNQTEQSTVRSPPTFITLNPGDKPGNHGFVLDRNSKCFEAEPQMLVPKGYSPSCWYVVINNFLVMPLISLYRGSKDISFSIMDPRTFEWYQMPKVLHGYSNFQHLVEDGKHVYIVGSTKKNGQTTDEIVRYNFMSDKWRLFGTIPAQIRDYSVCALNGELYVTGGIPAWLSFQFSDQNRQTKVDKSKMAVASKSVYCMNLTIKEWDMKAPMINAHFNHKVHKLTINRVEGLAILLPPYLSCEFYNPITNQWSLFKFMIKRPLPPLTQMILSGSQCLNNEVFLQDVPHESKPGWKCVMRVTIPTHGRAVDFVYMNMEKSEETVTRVVLSPNKPFTREDF